jgi:4-hydroxy-2-oxoglutarate aldolase
MLATNKAVTAKYGVAGLKAALDLTGFFGGEPRSPLSGLTKPQKEDLINILKKAEIIK